MHRWDDNEAHCTVGMIMRRTAQVGLIMRRTAQVG